MTDYDQINTDIDMDMSDVFAEWFKCGIDEELDDEDREIIYNTLRIAYVMGRAQGRRDNQALLQDAIDEISRITRSLGE